MWPEGFFKKPDAKEKEAEANALYLERKEEQKKLDAANAKANAHYQKQKKLASKEAEANARYLRSSDAFDNRDGGSSPGDPGSGPDQSELCPSCGVRVRADGSCLC